MMKRTLLVATAWALLAGPLCAQGGMGPGPGTVHSVTASYVGLGDIRSGAKVAYSTQCYTASQANAAQVIRIRRASDTTETDLGFTSSCIVDLATAVTFCAATTCTVPKWYTLAGAGGCDLTQTTVGNQPGFDPSNGNVSFGGVTTFMSCSLAAVAYPMSMVGVIYPLNALAGFQAYFAHLLTGTGLFTGNYLQYNSPGATLSAVSVVLNSFGVSTTTATLAANTNGAVGGVFPSTTSRTSYLNGTAATTDTTSENPTTQDTIFVGAGQTNGANNYYGTIRELVLYPSDATSDMGTFSTNQHTRFGF